MTNPLQNDGEEIEEIEAESGEALEAAAEAAEREIVAEAPAAAAGGGRTYTVKPGDSLSKIAQALTGDLHKWKALHEANKDQIKDPNVIRPGQVLRLPF